MSAKKIAFFNCGLEVKGLDEKTGEFEGYASTFGNVDLGGDKVLPGAFKKTIREAKGKFPVLADHDPSKQIGWNLEASEDDHGLLVKGQLLINDVALAKERYALMKRALELKVPAGLSIGYSAVRWDIDQDKEGMRFRNLKEIKLYEYSLVTFPMNTQAMATAAKQFDAWLKSMDSSEHDLVNNFVARLIEEGFNGVEIKSALLGAAEKIETPVPSVAHLFDQAASELFK